MSVNTRHNRRHDILGTTMFRKKDFDARAGGLRGFDEDEFVFVGQDHRDDAGNLLMRTVFGKLPKATASPRRIRPAAEWQAGAPQDRAVVIYCGLRALKPTSVRSPSSIASTRISERSMLS